MWIAALAAAHNIPLHPLGVTGLDRVTGIHVLSAQLRLAPRAVVNAVTGTHPGTRTPMP